MSKHNRDRRNREQRQNVKPDPPCLSHETELSMIEQVKDMFNDPETREYLTKTVEDRPESVKLAMMGGCFDAMGMLGDISNRTGMRTGFKSYTDEHLAIMASGVVRCSRLRCPHVLPSTPGPFFVALSHRFIACQACLTEYTLRAKAAGEEHKHQCDLCLVCPTDNFFYPFGITMKNLILAGDVCRACRDKFVLEKPEVKDGQPEGTAGQT